jgi:sulfonate transport system permease protein
MMAGLMRWRALRALAFPALLLAALEVVAHAPAPAATRWPRPAPPAGLGARWRDGSLWGHRLHPGQCRLGLALGAGLGVRWARCWACRGGAAAMGFLSIELLRPIPSVALIPLAMLVFGFGLRMEVSVVAFATLWPMLILSQAAVRQVEPQLLEVARALELPPAALSAGSCCPPCCRGCSWLCGWAWPLRWWWR